MSFKAIMKNFGGMINKNSPQILTGFACVGVVTTTVLAVRATPRALQLLEDEESYRDKHDLDYMNGFDKVKVTWKCYIPAVVTGATTLGCILGASHVHSKRNAALASLYALSDTAFREYKSKVVQEIGRTRETKVRDEIARDRVLANPPTDGVIFVGDGDVLCYDSLSGRYFKSSYESIRQKVNDLNYRLRNEMTISLNDFYYEIGLASIAMGDQMEFNVEKGLIEPNYSSVLTEEGKPCLSIELEVYPCF